MADRTECKGEKIYKDILCNDKLFVCPQYYFLSLPYKKIRDECEYFIPIEQVEQYD